MSTFRLSRSSVALAAAGTLLAVMVPAAPAASSHDGPHASISNASVSEGDSGTTPMTFTISLDEGPLVLDEWTVKWEVREVSGSAVEGEDYPAGQFGTVTFGANLGMPASEDITVQINGDTAIEPNEVFEVHLVAEGTSEEIEFADPVGVGTILNDDTAIAINDASVLEGDSGTRSMRFTVELAAPSSKEVTVDYATADGTAKTGDNDYQATSGTLTFTPGQSLKAVEVPVVGDHREEPDETFTVTLSNPTNATLQRAKATGTIRDDDQPLSVTAPSNRAVETADPQSYTATVSDPARPGLKVTWDFGDGSDPVTGNPVTYAYERSGTFTLRVTVTDGQGSTDSDTARVTAFDSGVISRASGTDRIRTAIDASRKHWPDGRAASSGHTGPAATDALIAFAYKYPDALAAGPLSARLDAPLLLSDTAAMSPEVEAELARLAVRTVWLLGGPNSLSPAIEQRLTDLGYEVRRRSGDTRFHTAAAVAVEVGRNPAGEVVLALGEHETEQRAFPDALSSGSLAASPQNMPVLLTRTNELPAVTEQALQTLQTRKVWIVGGPSSVSPVVEARLAALGYQVERLAGDGRYETSVAAAQEALSRAAAGPVHVVFATGQNFPDGLAGGAIAGRLDGILLLVPNGPLPETTRKFLDDNAARFDQGVILGGFNTLSETVRVTLANLMDNDS